MNSIIALMIFVLLLVFLFYKSQQKIKAVKQNTIIIINSLKKEANTFIFNNYAIPLQIKHSQKVEVLIPDLDNSGQLQYHTSYYDLSLISIPKFSKHKKVREFIAINEIKKYVKEHNKIEKELSKLQEQRSEIEYLAKLTLQSDMYSNQIETFDRALLEIDKLIEKAKQLETLYISLIRESLIGVKLKKYSPNLLNSDNNSIAYETKYQQLKEEYFYLKDTTKAYEDLMRKYHR